MAEPVDEKKEAGAVAGGENLIDVVLNCLVGDYIPLSLEALAPKGRFVELGKRDIWTKEQVAEKRPDVLYETIAVDHMMEESPQWFGEMLDHIRGLVDQGRIQPIPLHIFDLTSTDVATGAIAAFRFLQRAQHVGKVVLQIPSALRSPFVAPELEATTKKADGVYAITGGLGALGLLVANWLVDEGAKYIALVSRRGQPTEERAASSLWKRLTAPAPQGKSPSALLQCFACDVSSKAKCEQLLGDLETAFPGHPIKGIFHAAGALEDAAMDRQTRDSISKVYLSKV